MNIKHLTSACLSLLLMTAAAADAFAWGGARGPMEARLFAARREAERFGDRAAIGLRAGRAAMSPMAIRMVGHITAALITAVTTVRIMEVEPLRLEP